MSLLEWDSSYGSKDFFDLLVGGLVGTIRSVPVRAESDLVWCGSVSIRSHKLSRVLGIECPPTSNVEVDGFNVLVEEFSKQRLSISQFRESYGAQGMLASSCEL